MYNAVTGKTEDLIVSRSRRLRVFAIAAMTMILFIIVTAGVTLNWQLLSGILLIAPLIGLYFVSDLWLVRRWMSMVFEAWQETGFNLFALSQILRTKPNLPQKTVNTMLNELCDLDNFKDETRLTGIEREALSAAVLTIYDFNLVHAAVNMLVLLTSSIALILALSFVSWWPVVLLLLYPVKNFISTTMYTVKLKLIEKKITALATDGKLTAKVKTVIQNLRWPENITPNLCDRGEAHQ